jgi:hypothetical protein
MCMGEDPEVERDVSNMESHVADGAQRRKHYGENIIPPARSLSHSFPLKISESRPLED